MKIAMFGHKQIPSRTGGVEIVVGELSTRMAALGHDVTCYNRGGKEETDRGPERSGGGYLQLFCGPCRCALKGTGMPYSRGRPRFYELSAEAVRQAGHRDRSRP